LYPDRAQEYIVSSLPGVGPTLSGPLLEKFGNVVGVMTAHEALLKEIDKIGEKKAGDIRKILDEKYQKYQ